MGAVRWVITWEVKPWACAEEHGSESALTGQTFKNSLYEWVIWSGTSGEADD